MPSTRCYRDGRLHSEGFPLARIKELMADPANVIWFDLCAPTPSELALLGDDLGLHALAIEDLLTPGQRPKLDHYPQQLLMVAYSVSVDPATRTLRSNEVGVFVTANTMATVHVDAGFDIDAVTSRWDATAHLAGSGVAFLLHGLLDYVVDTQFDAAGELDSQIDAMEDRLFDDATSDVALQQGTFQLRKSLVGLRRLVLPMREVVNSLLRRDLSIVDQTMAPYFQDVYDHILRATEWTDSLRDLLSNILETRLTVRGNRLNVIMKKVTSWAAIIAVPTAITGFYGQNVPYPGFAQHWGFWFSSASILLMSSCLYIVFKVKDWL